MSDAAHARASSRAESQQATSSPQLVQLTPPPLSSSTFPSRLAGHFQSGSRASDVSVEGHSFEPDAGFEVATLDPSHAKAISAAQVLKFHNFERQVMMPFAEKMQMLDPESEVLIAGSYRNNPQAVRLFSDLDLIVISPGLSADPQLYATGLYELAELSNRWSQNATIDGENYRPVFFTRAMREMNSIQLASLLHGIEDRLVTPCHFLFYGSRAELRQREPELLGDRLLGSAYPLGATNIDSTIFAPRRPTITALENALWDVERSTSELILNLQAFSGIERGTAITIQNFCADVYNSLRGLADSLPLANSKRTVEDTLRYLDLDRSEALLDAFKPLEVVRIRGWKNEPEVVFQTIGVSLLGAMHEHVAHAAKSLI